MIKRISILLMIALILLTNLIIPKNIFAIEQVNGAQIYSKGVTDGLLMWNGMVIHTYIAVYQNNGKEYPAYCLNRELAGVELGTQTVDINELISNVMVWRVITNGYPYKTIGELGCNTEAEAYLATKQAVYCVLTDRDPNTYSAIGEAGERTLNALKQILENAKNSSATKASSELKIEQKDSLWKVDNLDKRYVYQEFSIKSYANIDTYEVNLEDINIEGAKIVDLENNEKNSFNKNENFKVLIPVKNINQDGNFSINVSSKVATKPVLYGKSVDSSLQNYAISGYIYEDGIGNQKVYYTKNNTKIIINKKDDKEKSLQGVEFNLLDENKNIIYTELKTNENGTITIEDLIPGTYYVQETKTLDGYDLYDKQIEVDVELNQEATVNVLNSEKNEIIKKEESKTELTVENNKTTTEIKLPKTGM